MKSVKIIIIAMLGILITGCCRCNMVQKRYGKPLVGTQWQLVQFEGRDVTPSDNYTIQFANDNTFSGIAECNRMLGRYIAFENGNMEISNIGLTRMACPNMEREQRFIEILESVTDYKMDGPMLMLICDGELRAIFQAMNAELPPER